MQLGLGPQGKGLGAWSGGFSLPTPGPCSLLPTLSLSLCPRAFLPFLNLAQVREEPYSCPSQEQVSLGDIAKAVTYSDGGKG